MWNIASAMGQIKDDKLLQKVADRIKQIREHNNITQEVFYNDIGIHIARIEARKANISLSTLNAICKYFQMSLSEFFSEID